ncbi:hypothetical protein ACVXG8_17380 [Escherichia coli]
MRTISDLQDCATEAEIATEFLYIDDIGLGEKVSSRIYRIR